MMIDRLNVELRGVEEKPLPAYTKKQKEVFRGLAKRKLLVVNTAGKSGEGSPGIRQRLVYRYPSASDFASWLQAQKKFDGLTLEGDELTLADSANGTIAVQYGRG